MLFDKKELDSDMKGRLKAQVFDVVGCCQAVHKEQGPELTEYIYQDSLAIAFEQAHIPYVKEFYFKPSFRGIELQHRLFVDFLCKNSIFLECKAIEKISSHERLQLWNYMRVSGMKIGILYNFAPVIDECEKYYFDPVTRTISYF